MAIQKIIVTSVYLLDDEIVGKGPYTHEDLDSRVEDGEILVGTSVSAPVEISEDEIEGECEGIGEDVSFFQDAFE